MCAFFMLITARFYTCVHSYKLKIHFFEQSKTTRKNHTPGDGLANDHGIRVIECLVVISQIDAEEEVGGGRFTSLATKTISCDARKIPGNPLMVHGTA